MKCPLCREPMVERSSLKTGRFWGCSDYPNCIGTRDITAKPNAYQQREDEDELFPSARQAANDKKRWERE